MDWYGMIKRFYAQKLWTINQVKDAVRFGKINESQYKEITGEDYAQ